MTPQGAELGHPVSLNGMGFLHMGGHGVPLNFTEAARYFQRAPRLAHMTTHARARPHKHISQFFLKTLLLFILNFQL